MEGEGEGNVVHASVVCWVAPPPHFSDRCGHSHVGHTLFILVDGVELEVGGAQAPRGVVWVHDNVHNIAGKGNTLSSTGGEETRSMCVCMCTLSHNTHLIPEVQGTLFAPTELILVSCVARVDWPQEVRPVFT